MTFVVCLISFLSGASALIFETLWFRQASLAFGSSIWASSLVLASFMGGLAVGNGVAARYGERIQRSFRAYAMLELTIGLTGFGLTGILYHLQDAVVPLFRPFLDQPFVLNALRLVLSFLLLVVPATAMGSTLPVLMKALSRSDAVFGRALGRLYGWNTLGAVAGALMGETVLIAELGIRGASAVAASLNVIAAACAYVLSRRLPAGERGAEAVPSPGGDLRLSPRGRRILGAAFLAGAILLAFEVVWFRFLQLFVMSTSAGMTLLLTVVLLGIGLGGLAASNWIGRSPAAPGRYLVPLAISTGTISLVVYFVFQYLVGGDHGMSTEALSTLALAVPLVFPTSLSSGLLFTFLGSAMARELGAERLGAGPSARAAGLLTLANTLGAMVGALAGGFVLLPGLGVERAFLSLAMSYALVAYLAETGASDEEKKARGAREVRILRGCVLIFLVALAIFPFGLMKKQYLPMTARRYFEPGLSIVATREGLTETIVYTRKMWNGRPFSERLITNGFSMSGTVTSAKRYMKLYVYWPMAVHPNPKNALLISFGVGMTAKALADTKSLETIDVVDISSDILELRKVVFPTAETDPLRDPRVTVHVEDGRYFLRTTERRFDLITGEPPPPKAAGIVNLYTREYFQLIHDRLAPGGMTTYWLPVDDLLVEDSKAIVRAFCDAFSDCSLWAGSGLQWMLVGTRDAAGPVSEAHFAQQWSDPVVGRELRALGFEVPEQLGALFIADAPRLAELTADVQALEDDYPHRLSPALSPGTPGYLGLYVPMMDPGRARERFSESALIKRLWPESLRAKTLPYFDVQKIINHVEMDLRFGVTPPLSQQIAWLHQVQAETPLTTLPLWIVGSDANHQRLIDQLIADGQTGEDTHAGLGLRALAERRYAEADRELAQVTRAALPRVNELRTYSLAMAGRTGEAARLASSDAGAADPDVQRYVRWLADTLGVREGAEKPAPSPESL